MAQQRQYDHEYGIVNIIVGRYHQKVSKTIQPYSEYCNIAVA